MLGIFLAEGLMRPMECLWEYIKCPWMSIERSNLLCNAQLHIFQDDIKISQVTCAPQVIFESQVLGQWSLAPVQER